MQAGQKRGARRPFTTDRSRPPNSCHKTFNPTWMYGLNPTFKRTRLLDSTVSVFTCSQIVNVARLFKRCVNLTSHTLSMYMPHIQTEDTYTHHSKHLMIHVPTAFIYNFQPP